MTSGDEWKWMIAKLSGNSNPEDEILLSNWIQASRQNKVLFDEVTRLWESSNLKLQLDNPATGEEWERLQTRIQNHKNNWISLPQTWLAAAASVVILVGLIYYLIPSSPLKGNIPLAEKKVEKKPEVVAEVKDNDIHIASASKVMTITLPDSSKVWLNTNSKLSYSNSFIKDRSVHLVGEAYFMVNHLDGRPFSVQTRFVSTMVIGTSFNVKEQDSMVLVTVAKGKVKMKDRKGKSEMTLSAKERGTYQNGSVTKSADNLSSFASWREKNNSSYNEEKKSPSSYLNNKYTWKKNQINRSVIEGSLTNNATLTTYHRIVLKATYVKPKNKKTIVVKILIDQAVRPGQTINYQKKLLDVLTHAQSFKVEVESAESIPNQYF
jgi:transmembrane sensor